VSTVEGTIGMGLEAALANAVVRLGRACSASSAQRHSISKDEMRVMLPDGTAEGGIR
jgi:hypothetical protein